VLVGALLAGGAMAQDDGAESFAEWREGVRSEALSLGISASTFDTAFSGIEPIPRVIELDRSQPEVTITFDQYLERVVPDSRVNQGRELLAKHRALLEPIGREYGVPPRFIVALWGIETSFGRFLGGFPVIGALATLAHDGRRSAYFREELLNALRILEDGHITPDAMVGSWAGAMGQSQFMPSSFVNYAVDHDGDGRRDIWGTHADVFASAANYLAQAGWNAGETWGRQVQLPAGFDRDLTGLKVKKTLAEWQAMGLRRADGADLPQAAMSGSVVLPGGEGGPAYLVYDNYRTIMRWNRSFYFATSVGLLADRIGRR
jgi:membrane-bound lytic murein transglycosylase B